ncbi:hypothetical protein V6N11_083238 [Hibiscus sabdariffa]|uniref:Uncharacterized protein n=1 Tax=Hibiscus sabdariffa TaxID=183260 RepID=A0ABR2QL97_9ROSI
MSMGMGEDDLMNPGVEVFATIKDIELAELFRFFSFFPDYLLALAMKQTVKIYEMEAPKGECEKNVRCNILVSHGYLYVECQGV